MRVPQGQGIHRGHLHVRVFLLVERVHGELGVVVLHLLSNGLRHELALAVLGVVELDEELALQHTLTQLRPQRPFNKFLMGECPLDGGFAHCTLQQCPPRDGATKVNFFLYT